VATVRLRLQTSPDGAQVYEGAVLVGTAPLTLTRPLNKGAELRFTRAGYAAVTRRFDFAKDDEVTVALAGAAVDPGRRPAGPARPAAVEPAPTPAVKAPDKPALVDPYATEPATKDRPRQPDLKEGVY
jgi:hypothetical protein